MDGACVHAAPTTASVDLRLGALVEPLAVACHDVTRAALAPGESAVVLGGGPIGLLVALVARERGAYVLVSEPNPFRASLAAELGFDLVGPSSDLRARVLEATNDAGADVVFEVSGAAVAAATMTELACLRGRIVVVAIHPDPQPVRLFDFFWKELTMVGARVYEPADYETAIALLAAGTLSLDCLVTSIEPLKALPGLFKTLQSRPDAMRIPRGLPRVSTWLEGSTIVVTGCRRGIGRAVAISAADAGADVVGVSATLAQDGEDVGGEVRARGRSFRGYACDFAQREAVLGLLRSLEDDVERIDVLVNNAGTIVRQPASEHTDDAWDTVIAVNLSSQFVLTRELGSRMVQRGAGKIVFVASLLSFQGGITVPGYAASKGGVAQLTKALANEWAIHGVNVNAVVPGYIETDNTQALRDDPDRSRQILERIPAGRWGTPADVAAAVMFLASPAARYVHGALLPVDGGWLAR